MDGEIVGSRVAAGQRVCVDAEQRQLSWDVRHGPGHSMQPGLEAGHTTLHQPVALPTSELRMGSPTVSWGLLSRARAAGQESLISGALSFHLGV